MKGNCRNIKLGVHLALAFGFMTIAFTSCRENLSPTEYAKCMTSTDNGPIATQENKGFTFELQYRFPKYEALISMTGETVNRDSIQSREELFGTDHKFKLRLYPSDKSESVLKKGTKGQAQYFERIQYFSSAVQEDFAVVTNTDTLYASNSILERSYGMAPYIDLIVSFNKKENQELKQLIFLDRALSKENITFDITEITNERNYPKLKI